VKAGEQTMATVSIRPALRQPLQKMADDLHITVEELVNQVIEKRLRELSERRIDEEREQNVDKVIALREEEESL
jgi:hypothetical protein